MRVAIIPARGGSSRIPRKNVRPFFGRPIIEYSIDTALTSALFDQVLVSTEDEEIALVAQRAGAVVHARPPQLANNEVGTQEVATWIVRERREITKACVIYATIPMLTREDLWDGYRALMRSRDVHGFVMSVGAHPLRDAGMYYWGLAEAWRAASPLIWPHTTMIPVPEARIVDINVEADWQEAERRYAQMNQVEQCAAS